MYKLIGDVLNEDGSVRVKTNIVYHKEKKVFIPFAEDNTDYQEYLAWIAEGNTPEPADE